MISDEEYIEAGINIERFEREVIRTLLEYGSKPYTEEQLTVDYILNEIKALSFENELHQKFIAKAEELRTDEKIDISEFFLNHINEEFNNLAITLILGGLNKYDAALSEGWLKKKIETATKEDIYKADINTEIYWLKFWRIKLLEIEVLKRIKAATPTDDFTKLLMMKRKVDAEKQSLAKIKNTVYTPK